ncbi:hypothetical protein OG216_04470 [Streptomycetaceae bacterium NBC_01309]
MTKIGRRVFKLTRWPWDTLPWVQVPEGLEFTLYYVTPLSVGTEVDATGADEERWQRALDAFEGELLDAQSDVRWAHGVRTKAGFMVDSRAVRLRRYDLVPGRRRRSRQAWALCEARMRAAEAAYRPVKEEIETRIRRSAGPVAVLRRWEEAGGVWRVVAAKRGDGVTVALCRCDGGEEADRLTSADPDLVAYVERRLAEGS